MNGPYVQYPARSTHSAQLFTQPFVQPFVQPAAQYPGLCAQVPPPPPLPYHIPNPFPPSSHPDPLFDPLDPRRQWLELAAGGAGIRRASGAAPVQSARQVPGTPGADQPRLPPVAAGRSPPPAIPGLDRYPSQLWLPDAARSLAAPVSPMQLQRLQTSMLGGASGWSFVFRDDGRLSEEPGDQGEMSDHAEQIGTSELPAPPSPASQFGSAAHPAHTVRQGLNGAAPAAPASAFGAGAGGLGASGWLAAPGAADFSTLGVYARTGAVPSPYALYPKVPHTSTLYREEGVSRPGERQIPEAQLRAYSALLSQNPAALPPLLPAGKLLCPICKREFSYRGSFEKHVLVHVRTRRALPTAAPGPAAPSSSTHHPPPSESADPAGGTASTDAPPAPTPAPADAPAPKAAEVSASHSAAADAPLAGPEPEAGSHPLADSEIFRCAVCGNVYTRFSNYRAHLEKYKPRGGIDATTAAGKTAAQALLMRHLQNSQRKRTRVCETCGHSFQTARELYDHITSVHTEHRCEKCDLPFPNAAALAAHIRLHSQEDGVSCPECGLEFPSIDEMAAHRASHVAGRKGLHSCTICGKIFLREGAYIRHMWRHDPSTYKMFKCRMCGSPFVLEDNRMRHELTCGASKRRQSRARNQWGKRSSTRRFK